MVMLLSKNKPVILIDSSYYVFYRYFATMRWFTFQKKTFDIDTITENEEFIQFFTKHVESDLQKICKKWKTSIENLIFCTDCQRCNIWRNDIFPEYKGSRVQNNNFNNKIFNIFSDFVTDKDIKKVWLERLEADDIVYLCLKKLKNKISRIHIITNDNDYLQLASDNVTISNMQFKDITLRGSKNPQVDLYFKTIFGDKSDNIQRISPTITKEKAQELSNLTEKEIMDWMIENNLYEKFQFNLSLISFEYIPKSYIDEFNKTIVFEII